MSSIKTAIIAASGNGTRMSPITNTIPKEMLSVGNVPVIDYILYDCHQAGIRNIIIVVNQSKATLISYICKTKEVDFKKDLSFTFVPQNSRYGTACILQSVQHIVTDPFFALVFPDEIFLSEKTSLQQMVTSFEKTRETTLGVFLTDENNYKNYGIIQYKVINNKIILTDIIEKPQENPPSYWALCGRYIFNRDIFQYLQDIPLTKGEYYLTDAIRKAIQRENIGITILTGDRYDCGNKESYMKFISDIYKKRIDIFENEIIK